MKSHDRTGGFPPNDFLLPANSSALSQPGDAPPKSLAEAETASLSRSADSACEGEGEREEEEEEAKDDEEAATPPGASGTSSANDMLCTSQTLDDEPLTPEVVAPPKAAISSR